MTDSEADAIIAALGEKGANHDCPICDNDVFNLEDGFFFNILQDNPHRSVRVTGEGIPTVILTCARCGFVRQHTLGQLGLLERLRDRWERQ